jgi:isoleucyl-tRNA synthetase
MILEKKQLKQLMTLIFFQIKEKRDYYPWLKEDQDWCVSRQRVWGVPLPIFINKKTKEPLRDKKVIDRIASIYEEQGSDCWFTDDPKVFLGD